MHWEACLDLLYDYKLFHYLNGLIAVYSLLRISWLPLAKDGGLAAWPALDWPMQRLFGPRWWPALPARPRFSGRQWLHWLGLLVIACSFGVFQILNGKMVFPYLVLAISVLLTLYYAPRLIQLLCQQLQQAARAVRLSQRLRLARRVASLRIQALISQHHQQLQTQASQYDAQLQALQARHAQELQDLQAELALMRASIVQLEGHKQAAQQSSDAEIAQLQADLSTSVQLVDALSAPAGADEASRKKVQDLQGQLARAKRKAQQQQASYDEQLNHMRVQVRKLQEDCNLFASYFQQPLTPDACRLVELLLALPLKEQLLRVRMIDDILRLPPSPSPGPGNLRLVT
ncbi:hypothetical protein V8J88_18040 [Massilia sp. W12]|uniref:hypothetical protein n=1 Tax=Massilia sp. W12 TaxID=3126507 RepID=UPI0030CBE588